MTGGVAVLPFVGEVEVDMPESGRIDITVTVHAVKLVQRRG